MDKNMAVQRNGNFFVQENNSPRMIRTQHGARSGVNRLSLIQSQLQKGRPNEGAAQIDEGSNQLDMAQRRKFQKSQQGTRGAPLVYKSINTNQILL